jgi:hypothetical protein
VAESNDARRKAKFPNDPCPIHERRFGWEGLRAEREEYAVHPRGEVAHELRGLNGLAPAFIEMGDREEHSHPTESSFPGQRDATV